jgi:hypothetical protein
MKEHLMSNLIIATDAVQLDEPEPVAVPKLTDAQQAAIGLRRLADLLDANPDLSGCTYGFGGLVVMPRDRAGVAAWARAAMRSTGKAVKYQGGSYAGVDITFGPVELHVRIEREEICERVVTGTREVTEEVPDPEALAALPLVEVTRTEEIVEWRCGSLLEPAVSA